MFVTVDKSIIIALSVFAFSLLTHFASAQDQPILILKAGDNKIFRSVDISSDGKYILTGDNNGASLWDAISGEELYRYTNIGAVYYVGFSPNGKWAVSSGLMEKIEVWDLKTGNTIFSKTFSDPSGTGLTNTLGDVKFTSDSKYIIFKNQSLQAWDFLNAKQIVDYEDIIYPIGFGFFPLNNPDLLLIRESGEKLVIRDFCSGNTIQEISGGVDVTPRVSANRRYVSYIDDTLGSSKKVFTIFDLEASELVCSISEESIEYRKELSTAAVSNAGDIFITSGFESEENRAVIAKTDSKQDLRDYEFTNTAYSSEPNKVYIFPNGKKFLSHYVDTIEVFDISDLTSSISNSKSMQ